MHDESLSARVPCQARHGRNRLVEPAGFGPATFPLRTGCAASAPRPHAGPSLCGKGRLEKESFGWRRYAAGALGRIRTGDAHLRRVALFPLSYGGVCLLPATTPASVLRVGGVHIGPPVLAALAGWRLFHPSDGVLRAFHADAFDYPSNMTGHRIPLPISRSSVNCGRAPRGIRTHNPRLKRTLL